MTKDTKNDATKKIHIKAFLLCLVILLVLGASLGYILLSGNLTDRSDAVLIAKIYQNGALIETIDLSQVTDGYSFQIDAKDGGYNTIEVRPDAIGMTDADCPDGLCVAMSFKDASLLPIVCLPHELVIEINRTAPMNPGATAPDIIAY